MRLLIVRHAEAAPGNPDELRPLTPEGREHARRLGVRLRERGFAPDAVVSSPLLRARETAEALGLGEPEVDERLAPGATPLEVRDAAAGRGETVVVVGHQPDCSQAVAALTGGDEPAFPPGGHVLVELDAVTAISVRGLRKAYGDLEAVRGVDFDIEEGEVFGLLGPNGAGKTTTVEILEGYRTRDAGEVRGARPRPAAPRPASSASASASCSSSRELWPNLTVRETHRVFAGYYAQPRDVDEVIELVGLVEKRNARVKTLSGGQKRRLDLGVALVGDPDLVFLDEPTTGFDPAARRAAWEMIRSLRSLGKTVLLTTHYLDEAEQLADRVAVMREGLIVTIGTPRELTSADLEVEIRYRRDGEDVVLRTTRADARAERADGARRSRAARSSSGSRCAGRRSKTSTSRSSSEDDRVRIFLHELRYQQLVFWRSREAALFIFLFPLLLFVLLGSVYSGKIYGVPAPEALLAGLIGYGCANTAFAGLAIQLVVRRELGDPEAAARDAAAGVDVHRGDARLDADRVRAPDRRALRARPRLLRDAVPARARLARARGRDRRGRRSPRSASRRRRSSARRRARRRS